MTPDAYFADRVGRIDEALSACFPEDRCQPARLYQAIRYSLLDGGKRIRPLLVIAAAEAVGGRCASALPFACAVEMIHAYSLIHDDLPAMDDDRLRRGKPTNHLVFGEALAILAGDALLTEAFRVISEPATHRRVSPKRALLAVNTIAAAAGARGMVGGQVADIEAEGEAPTLPVVEFIHRHKTGALILAAVRVGALVGRARPSSLRCLSGYGECLGLAFQIADDVLDARGAPAQTGKESGGDARRGKATYVSVVGLQAACRQARALGGQAVQHIEGFGRRAEPLRRIAASIIDRLEG